MARDDGSGEAVDMRSDTVTRPTDAMRQAMAEACVGDDGYRDDATVHRLEEMSAEILGKEASLFVTSGTMGNLVALLTHARRGKQVLLEKDAHILHAEMGAIASVAGLPYHPLPGVAGQIDLDALDHVIWSHKMLRRPDVGLICVENTHGGSGGRILPLDHLDAIRNFANQQGIAIHMDGARLFNAAIASDITPAAIAARADSVTFCLSKGLSAPFGSLLAGTRAFVERARNFRRMVGGGMRQAGIMAAAGILAISKEMIDRLADDHRRARLLAEGIAVLPSINCNPEGVETNMVLVSVQETRQTEQDWVAGLGKQGVLCCAVAPGKLRLVTNRHIDDIAVSRAVAAFRRGV